MGKGGQVGSRVEMRRDGEENHREAALIRCCDGFVSLSLIRSPHSSLFVSLSFSGVPHSAAKKNKHLSFTFNLSSVQFCSCVTLDDKGVKSKCPSHYVFHIICFCLCGNMAFFIASNTTSSTLLFLFWCLHLSCPHDVYRGRSERVLMCVAWGQAECWGLITAQIEVPLAKRKLQRDIKIKSMLSLA